MHDRHARTQGRPPDAVPIAGLVMGSAAMVEVSRVAVLLTFSGLLSFISIRAMHQTLARRCERSRTTCSLRLSWAFCWSSLLSP